MNTTVKKIITGTAILFATNAMSTDLTVLNTGSKTGYFFVQSNAYARDLGKTFKVDFVNPGQYCAAYAALQKITGPVLFPWAGDFEAAGRDGKGCATVPVEEHKIIKFYRDTFQICSARPEMTAERFITKGQSLRVAHSTPNYAFSAAITQGVNKSFGTFHTPVHYEAGGGAVKTALVNKEVDYALIPPKFAKEAVDAGQAKCFYVMSLESESGLVPLAAKDITNKKLIVASDTIWYLYNADKSTVESVKKIVKALHKDPNSNISKATKTDSPTDWNKTGAAINHDWENSVNNLRQ
jgi:hypothetical protein